METGWKHGKTGFCAQSPAVGTGRGPLAAVAGTPSAQPKTPAEIPGQEQPASHGGGASAFGGTGEHARPSPDVLGRAYTPSALPARYSALPTIPGDPRARGGGALRRQQLGMPAGMEGGGGLGGGGGARADWRAGSALATPWEPQPHPDEAAPGSLPGLYPATSSHGPASGRDGPALGGSDGAVAGPVPFSREFEPFVPTGPPQHSLPRVPGTPPQGQARSGVQILPVSRPSPLQPEAGPENFTQMAPSALRGTPIQPGVDRPASGFEDGPASGGTVPNGSNAAAPGPVAQGQARSGVVHHRTGGGALPLYSAPSRPDRRSSYGPEAVPASVPVASSGGTAAATGPVAETGGSAPTTQDARATSGPAAGPASGPEAGPSFAREVNPAPSTLNTQHSTLNLQPSTLNPQP